jgi:hypothetical protein
MRYEISDYERTAIKPMLPNKPRDVRRVNDPPVGLGSHSVVWLPVSVPGFWNSATETFLKETFPMLL